MSPHPHTAQVKSFTKLLRTVSQRESCREADAFEKFLEIAYLCTKRPEQLLRGDAAGAELTEQRYLKLVRACHAADDTMRDYAYMLTELTAAYENDAQDFFFLAFSEMSAEKSFGQFFTPYHLCLTMAKLLLQDAPEMLQQATDDGRPYLTCVEPAAGVGGMIMAASEVFRELGICPSRQVHWHATELDRHAYHGCYVQLALTGVSADVIHGNTLSLQTFDQARTIMAAIHPKFERQRTPTLAAAIARDDPSPAALSEPVGDEPAPIVVSRHAVQQDLFT